LYFFVYLVINGILGNYTEMSQPMRVCIVGSGNWYGLVSFTVYGDVGRVRNHRRTAVHQHRRQENSSRGPSFSLGGGGRPCPLPFPIPLFPVPPHPLSPPVPSPLVPSSPHTLSPPVPSPLVPSSPFRSRPLKSS